MDQQPRRDHVLDRNAAAAEIFLEGETFGRRIADAEPDLGLRAERAAGKIAARLGAAPILQLGLEKPGGQLQHLVEAARLLGALNLFDGDLRQGQPDLAGKLFHGLGKGQALRFHQEAELVAVLARRETVIESLLVIDIEGRCLLRVERRQATPFAPLLLQLDAPADHLRHRKALPDLVQE